MLALVSKRSTADTGRSPASPKPRKRPARPSQRQAQRRHDEHPEQQQQQVLKAQFALIAPLSSLEKAKGGKRQALGLLAHDQVQQHRHASQDETAQEIAMNERHMWDPHF